MGHASTHHIGAIAFLIVDFFLFFGAAVLTVVQASQVCVLYIVAVFNYVSCPCFMIDILDDSMVSVDKQSCLPDRLQ